MTKLKKRLLMIGFIFWTVATLIFGALSSHIIINIFSSKSQWDKGYDYCLKQRMYKANKLTMPEIAGAGDEGYRKTYEGGRR